MRWLKRLFDFYINSSIHVSLAVLSLVGITEYQLELPLSTELYLFIFFGTITGYNFVKYAKIAGMYHRSLTRSLRAIQIFSFLALIPTIYAAWMLPRRVLWVSLFFGVFTLFYAVPIPGLKNLRNFATTKIFVVAWVWAGVTVVLPCSLVFSTVSTEVVGVFLTRLAFVFVLTLPFEIRDLAYDDQALKTVPQQLGEKTTQWLGTTILVGIVVYQSFTQVAMDGYFYSLMWACLLLVTGLWVSTRKKQSRYFASFWIESIPIVWYVFLVVL